MEGSYRKDMSHTTWAKVFERQVQRAELVGEWLEALHAGPGHRILDIGAGPGYVSVRAAEVVGPQGRVYAVDRSSEALAYLEQLQSDRGISQITRIAADAADLSRHELHADHALVTMMLHHADDPAGIMKAVAACLSSGGRVVAAEYSPEGPSRFGPPRDQRIPPDQAQAWCEEAGLRLLEQRSQTPDHYMLVLERL